MTANKVLGALTLTPLARFAADSLRTQGRWLHARRAFLRREGAQSGVGPADGEKAAEGEGRDASEACCRRFDAPPVWLADEAARPPHKYTHTTQVSWNREVSPSLYSRIREISASEQRQKWTFQSDDDEAPELGARSRRSRKTPAIVKQQMPLKQRPPLPRAPRDEWDVAAEVERRHGGHCERIEDWHAQQWQQLDEGFDSDYY